MYLWDKRTFSFFYHIENSFIEIQSKAEILWYFLKRVYRMVFQILTCINYTKCLMPARNIIKVFINYSKICFSNVFIEHKYFFVSLSHKKNSFIEMQIKAKILWYFLKRVFEMVFLCISKMIFVWHKCRFLRFIY